MRWATISKASGASSRRGHAIKAADAIKRLKAGNVQPNSLLAYGNGRSYGDTCLNSAGALIDMRTMDRILGFDPLTGVLEAEAGTLLCDIIAHAAPYGYFPQVVPGTQFVTLGGAIANDVHGKNHHRRGTFGRHVEAFKLLRSDGSIHLCTPTRDARLYEATIGGMGLTGMILSASIRLMRVDSLDIDERVVPFRDLGEFFDLIGDADAGNEYVVAWLDQLASGNRAGRGLLMTGNHARHGARAAQKSGSRLAVPLQPPVNLLSKPFLRLFNFAYRNRKAAAKSRHGCSLPGLLLSARRRARLEPAVRPARPLPAPERGAGADRPRRDCRDARSSRARRGRALSSPC